MRNLQIMEKYARQELIDSMNIFFQNREYIVNEYKITTIKGFVFYKARVSVKNKNKNQEALAQENLKLKELLRLHNIMH